jgi:hypothetical protein
MSLSVHEIEAEILTLPAQEQQKVIDFVIKLARQQTKPIKQVTCQTEGEKILSALQKNGFLGSMPDIPDLSENYKDYLDWSDKI